jgi:signal transduction histidine kinase
MSARRGTLGFRILGFALPLFLVLASAIALAFEALEATRAHRRAATATLVDYADFAAFIVSNVARQEIDRRLLYAFGSLRRYDPSNGPLPPPSVVGQDPSEASRCVASRGEPSFFRLDLATGEFVAQGRTLPEAVSAHIADTLAIVARDSMVETASFGHVLGLDTGADVIAWSTLRDSTGTAFAVYAKTSCLDVSGESIFALAMRAAPALPPSLTGRQPNDSLFSLRVTDRHDRVVFASPVATDSRITGHAGPLATLGGLVVATSIRPEIADRLVIGGVPYSRVPLALLLLLLILVFAALGLVQLRRQQELIRLREQFISNVSHELRTPLQQILVFSELLRMEKIESDEERRHSIAVVERETRRLIQLVDNVLRFSRASRDRDPLLIDDVALGDVVRDTVQAFEPLARSSGARILLDAEPDIQVRADADALRRILLNLLDNAVKYGPAKQTITVTLAREGERVVLRVDDQGPGVPPADRERIFGAFRRLEREERAAIAGSGVGLAIVRDLAVRMNGTVSATDAPDGGARFIVTLPTAVQA